MHKENQYMFMLVKDLFTEMLPLLARIEQLSLQNPTQVNQQVDTSFACRQTSFLLNELKKKVDGLKDSVDDMGGKFALVANEQTFRTRYTTATLTPKQWFKIPYKRTGSEEQFDSIMENIGVGDMAAKKELVRLHPPNFVDYIRDCQAKGIVPPVNEPQITVTKQTFKHRKKKEVDE